MINTEKMNFKNRNLSFIATNKQMDFSRLTVSQLKTQLQLRRLSTKGLKAVLRKRLEEDERKKVAIAALEQLKKASDIAATSTHEGLAQLVLKMQAQLERLEGRVVTLETEHEDTRYRASIDRCDCGFC